MSDSAEQSVAALLQPDGGFINWDDFDDAENLSLSTYCQDLFQRPSTGPRDEAAPCSEPCSSMIQLDDVSADAAPKQTEPVTHTQAAGENPSCHSKVRTACSGTQSAAPAADAARQQQSLHKQHSVGKPSRYDDEFKLQRNREAQKRFRMRHKAKSKDTEFELAKQRAELEQLRQNQQRLEQRNVLLERLTHINQQQQQQQQQYSAIDQGNPNHGSYSAAAPFVSRGPLLTLTLKGRPQILTREEISQLTFPQFAALYTEYNQAIGATFLELNQAGSPTALQRMQQLTTEALVLAGRAMLVPGMHQAVMNGRLDTGGPTLQKPDTAWYQRLLFVFNLSEQQCTDLMYIRRLNLHQRCALSLERKAIMAQMAQCEAQALVTASRSENLTSVSNLAACLQKNTAEDRLVYYQLARALYQGVLTTEQLAEGMLQSYPRIAVVETLLDTLAAQRGEPTKEQIVAAAQLKPATSYWPHFVQYVQQFERGSVHEYVPFLRH